MRWCFNFVGVVMGEYSQGCSRKFCSVDQAGVRKFIQDDDVARTDQAGNCADGCRVAGAEQEGALSVLERGDFFFKFCVRVFGAADQPGSA